MIVKGNIIPLFSHSDDIKTVIYVEDTIKPLNGMIKTAIKADVLFGNDTSAFKVIHFAIQRTLKRSIMPKRS